MKASKGWWLPSGDVTHGWPVVVATTAIAGGGRADSEESGLAGQGKGKVDGEVRLTLGLQRRGGDNMRPAATKEQAGAVVL